jgi:hypothetical protein
MKVQKSIHTVRVRKVNPCASCGVTVEPALCTGYSIWQVLIGRGIRILVKKNTCHVGSAGLGMGQS